MWRRKYRSERNRRYETKHDVVDLSRAQGCTASDKTNSIGSGDSRTDQTRGESSLRIAPTDSYLPPFVLPRISIEKIDPAKRRL